MAWPRCRKTRAGVERWTVEDRDEKGAIATVKRLGTVPRAVAVREAEAVTRARARERGALQRTPARRALAAYLREGRSRRLSKETLRKDREILGDLIAWMEPRCGALAKWRRRDFVAWVDALQKERPARKADGKVRGPLGPTSVRAYVYRARHLVRWLEKEEIEAPDFTRGVKGPKVRRAHRSAWKPKEVAAILRAVRLAPPVRRKRRDRPDRRYRAREWAELAVAIPAWTALSMGDLRILSWSAPPDGRGLWIDATGDVWWIRGQRSKSGEAVLVPVLGELRAVLERHRATHGLVVRGMPDDSAVSHAVGRAVRRAGLTAGGGLKKFRHSTATILISLGVPLPTVARYLAHAPGSLMTMLYVHPDEDDLIAAAKKLDEAIKKGA